MPVDDSTVERGAQLEAGERIALEHGQYVAGADAVADVGAHLAHRAGEARRDVRGAIGVRPHLARQLDGEVDDAGPGGGQRHPGAFEVGDAEAIGAGGLTTQHTQHGKKDE
jgi:hypothetical protein